MSTEIPITLVYTMKCWIKKYFLKEKETYIVPRYLHYTNKQALNI